MGIYEIFEGSFKSTRSRVLLGRAWYSVVGVRAGWGFVVGVSPVCIPIRGMGASDLIRGWVMVGCLVGRIGY